MHRDKACAAVGARGYVAARSNVRQCQQLTCITDRCDTHASHSTGSQALPSWARAAASAAGHTGCATSRGTAQQTELQQTRLVEQHLAQALGRIRVQGGQTRLPR